MTHSEGREPGEGHRRPDVGAPGPFVRAPLVGSTPRRLFRGLAAPRTVKRGVAYPIERHASDRDDRRRSPFGGWVTESPCSRRREVASGTRGLVGRERLGCPERRVDCLPAVFGGVSPTPAHAGSVAHLMEVANATT